MIRLAERLLNVVYPRRCPMCDCILGKGDAYVCSACIQKIRVVEEPYCMKCGKPLEEKDAEYCTDCTYHPHIFDRGRSLLVYEGDVRKSIYRFKYSGRKEYAQAYAHLAEEKLGDFIREIKPDALIPVPLHIRRFRKRGYNQAELFAKALGRRMGIPVMSKLVKRTRNTLPQKELDFAGRQNNLKKAFKLSRNDVKLYTTIIIDDIYTTGSTMDAVSMQLKSIGVKEIYFLTISGGK